MSEEQYQKFCKGEFKAIRDSVDHLSDRLFVSNGKRALVEVVRDNTKGRERQQQQIDDNSTKLDQIGSDITDIKTHIMEPQEEEGSFHLGKGGLSIKGVRGGDMVKIMLLVVILLYIVAKDMKLGEKFFGMFIEEHKVAVATTETAE